MHSAVLAGERLSTEELLAVYGGRNISMEQHEMSAGLNSTKQLMQQLQEALAAAHADKVGIHVLPPADLPHMGCHVTAE